MLEIINSYSGIISIAISLITAIVTLIYVVFTYRQMKAAQAGLKMSARQIKTEKQPCIVYKQIEAYGTECFSEDRRQLHIELELENIGDSPAISIYVFSHFKLQYVNEPSDIVNMEYLPDFIPFLKADSTVSASTRYETYEIFRVLEDLGISHVKNMQRIKSNPSKSAYQSPELVIEIYYKNIMGQWFKNERRVEVLDVLGKTDQGDYKPLNPPDSLEDDMEFELQLIAQEFALSNLKLVDENEIKAKLKPYERYRPFSPSKDGSSLIATNDI